MTTKSFDCVEMKRRGAERVRQRLAGMTLEQEIEYWRHRSEQFQQGQDQHREKLSLGKPEATPPAQRHP